MTDQDEITGTKALTDAASDAASAETPATPDPYQNESELERLNRLRLNTDLAPHSGEIGNDISSILTEAKLPERRDFRGLGEAAAPLTEKMPQSASELATQKEEAAAEPTERPIVVPLRTLKDDIQDIVRLRKISLVKAVALEEKKKQVTLIKPPPTAQQIARRRKTTFTTILIVVLIVCGCAAIYGVVAIQKNQKVTSSSSVSSILFAENTLTLSLTGNSPAALKQAIVQEETRNGGATGSIVRVLPIVTATSSSGDATTRPATLSEFLNALGIQPPTELMRNLGDTFFFGIHNANGGQPVFVIPVSSYDHAFNGMLAWESTMDADLAPVFPLLPTTTTDAGGSVRMRAFQDVVLHQFDTRALEDDNGAVVLYYAFLTPPKWLVIAENPYTFTEVLNRLQAQGM